MKSSRVLVGLLLALGPLPSPSQYLAQQLRGATALELIRGGSSPARGAKLVVQCFDLGTKPLQNVQVSAMGPNSVSNLSDAAGRAEIELPAGTIPGSWVTLYIVRAPDSYVLFEPMDGHVIVPAYANQDSYAVIRLCKKGDIQVIRDLKFVVTAASTSITIADPSHTSAGDLDGALALVAKKFNVPRQQLEQAIHQLNDKTSNPYGQGIIALFERRYTDAVRYLEQALKDSEDRNDVIATLNARLFLGQAFYLQGEYKSAAGMFAKAADLQPGDAGLLTGFALSLTKIRDYSGAANLFRRALAEREKELGPDSSELAAPLTQLATALGEIKEFAEAAKLQQRALPLWEKRVGLQDHQYALQLDNLITLYSNNGDYRAAIPYAGKRVELCKQASRADTECAVDLADLGTLYYNNEDYTGAEPPLREGLAIFERKLTTHDSDIVACYRKLARVRKAKGDTTGAESNFRKALDLLTADRGADSPDLVPILLDLAELLHSDKRHAAAAREYRRVLDIRSKNKPSGDRNVVTAKSNLGLELFEAGDYENAARLLNEALPLLTKYLGDGAAVVSTIQEVLAQIRDNASGRGL
jgi:tetratricopeptide (TPR) repeat protein